MVVATLVIIVVVLAISAVVTALIVSGSRLRMLIGGGLLLYVVSAVVGLGYTECDRADCSGYEVIQVVGWVALALVVIGATGGVARWVRARRSDSHPASA